MHLLTLVMVVSYKVLIATLLTKLILMQTYKVSPPQSPSLIWNQEMHIPSLQVENQNISLIGTFVYYLVHENKCRESCTFKNI